MLKSREEKFVFLLIIIYLFNSSIIFANNMDSFEEKEIREMNEDLKETNTQIAELDKEISEIQNELIRTKSAIFRAKYNIKKYEEKIENVEESIEERQELLKARLRVMYKHKVGDMGFLELLLSSKNVTDFVTRLNITKYIIQSDAELLKSLQRDKDALVESKNKVKLEKAFLEATKEKLKEKEDRLTVAIEGKKSFIDKITKNTESPLSNIKSI
jgi:peptidoglycan hydrolase CwlO-like protein